MSKKEDEAISQVIGKTINEKEHQWKDEELYSEHEEQEDEGCWDKMSRGCSNFMNRTIDYF